MAENKVQFQKGLSVTAFLHRFGTEERCVAALERWRWPHGFVCPACGHAGECVRLRTRALLQCRHCHHQTSITAGTIFEATQLPLRTWFLAMYVLTQQKRAISALALKRHLGVSYPTAWRVKHKLLQVMKERDDCLTLHGVIEVDDAYWGGACHDATPGPRLAEQGAVHRRARLQSRRTPDPPAHGQGGGFPHGRGGALRKAPLRSRCHCAERRPGLLRWHRRRRVRALASGDRRRPPQYGTAGIPLGQHRPRQRQERHDRHLPSCQRHAPAPIPRRVLFPLQSRPHAPGVDHRCSGRRVDSKTVPAVSEVCLRHADHCQSFCPSRCTNEWRCSPHSGQTKSLGQRARSKAVSHCACVPNRPKNAGNDKPG